VVVPVTFPPIMQEGSLFSTLPPAFVICGLINDGHSFFFFNFFFLVFLPFLGPLLRHMEVPRLGVESEL